MSTELDEMLKEMEENSIENCFLRDKKLSPEDAKRIANVLKRNTSVKTLDLWWNNIGNEGAIALGNALRENKTLVELDLWKNHIGNEGAIAIAEVLRENKTLVKLNLHWNDIGDEGCIAIARALRKNRHLQRLDLKNCGITNKGLISIAESLKENFSLSKLLLQNYFSGEPRNVFTDEGANSLLDALDVNMTLSYVRLTGTGVSYDVRTLINGKTKRNNSLSKKQRQHRIQLRRVNSTLKDFCFSDLKKEVPCNKAKIIFLGESVSGKTRTVRALTARKYKESRDRYTEGLEISRVDSLTMKIDESLEEKAIGGGTLIRQIVVDRMKESSVKEKEVEENVPQSPAEKEKETQDVDDGDERKVDFVSEADYEELEPSAIVKYMKKNRREAEQSTEEDTTIVGDIYDFGGHEVYRVISHFFMNSMAVYVIVLNLEESLVELKSHLSYYVSVVQTFAPEATILIVGTRSLTTENNREELETMIKEVKAELQTERIIEREIGGLFFIEHRGWWWTQDERNELKDTIMDLVKKVVKDREPTIPLLWSRLHDILRRKRAEEGIQVVGTKELSEIELGKCYSKYDEEKANPTIIKLPPEDVDPFIQRMKEYGMIYHFDTPEELSDYVILNPDWIMEGMKGVVTIEEAKSLKEEKKLDPRNNMWDDFLDRGVLCKKILDMISVKYWKENKEWHSYFMNLLQQQSLLYRLPNDNVKREGEGEEEKYIVPPLLPKDTAEVIPEMTPFLCVRFSRCFPPLEVYKLSFGLVKRKGWMYDKRSTRYGVLISKKEGTTRIFLLIGCDSVGMRQLLSISITTIHAKSKENGIAMEDLLGESMHEICVVCPGCVCDEKYCQYMSLEDLRKERTMVCELYSHSVSFEDIFEGERGEQPAQPEGRSNEQPQADSRQLEFLQMCRSIRLFLEEKGLEESFMNAVKAYYQNVRELLGKKWLPSNATEIIDGLVEARLEGFKNDDIRYLDRCIGQEMLGGINARTDYLESYPDTVFDM